MLALGKINKLKINRKTDFGLYLDSGTDGEVLLPKKYVTDDMRIGDTVEVIVYLDNEERPVATTEKPLAYTNEYAKLRVVDLTAHGAFLDWGLTKQLFLPFAEMLGKVNFRDEVLVYIYLDPLSNRIISSMKLDQFLEDKAQDEYQDKQAVVLLPFQETALGYKCVVDYTHVGILYKNEIFQPIVLGDKYDGYIKKVREDKKIDLTLQMLGHEKLDDISEKLYTLLKEQAEVRALSDKSDPDTIYRLTGMSKKNFKKGLGILFKKKMIDIKGDQTVVLK